MVWFTAKEWKNRLVEFAGRRSLKNVSTNETTVYDVTRNEGQVSQEGDSFSATTMNDLEQRISEGFSAAEEANSQLSSDLGGCRFGYTADGLPGYKKEGADTVYPFKNGGYLAIMVNSHTSYINNTTAVISINCSRKIEDDISFHDNENGFPITFNKQGRYRIRYTYLNGMNITVKLLQNDNLIHTISSPTRNVEYFYDINAEVGDKFSMTYTTSQTAVWFDCLITIEKI